MHLELHGGRIGISVAQRIDHVEIIFHIQILDSEGGLAGAGIDPDAFGIEWNCPEQPVIQAWIKVVYLIAEVRGRRPHVEVNSDEPE